MSNTKPRKTVTIKLERVDEMIRLIEQDTPISKGVVVTFLKTLLDPKGKAPQAIPKTIDWCPSDLS